MKHLNKVYCHKYDEKAQVWRKYEIADVLVFGTYMNYNLSDTLNRDATVTLRIMGDCSVQVEPQDIISFEATQDTAPPNNNTVLVVSVKKNQWGSRRVRHTKIICR